MADSINTLDDAALVTELARKERALVQARFSLSMNRLEDTSSLRVMRRDVARIKTELRRRELAEGLSKDTLIARHKVDPSTLGDGDGGAASGGLLSGVVDKLTP